MASKVGGNYDSVSRLSSVSSKSIHKCFTAVSGPANVLRAKKGISINIKLLARATVFVAIIVGLIVGLVIGLQDSSDSISSYSEMPTGTSFEVLPGSRYHAPGCNAGTWWGHNMAKLARGADGTLYSGYMNNSRDCPEASHFVMFRKTRQGEWVEGHHMPARVGANVLIDAFGNVHALVFQSTSNTGISTRLLHYWFPSGNTSASTPLLTPETVIDYNGTRETVNVRIGAALTGR
jgi:hypothetical protein